MILISELYEYTEELKAALPLVNKSHLVVNETEVVNYLSDMRENDNQMMLCVIPDAKSNAKDEDNINFNNALGFFFLEKTEYSNTKNAEWISVFARTQESVLAFVKKLVEDKTSGTCGFSRYLNVTNISIEPVTALASCNGWSVEVYFDTPF